jgi:effector-binding domain-containing protein
MEVCLPLAGEVKPPEGVEFKQLQGGKAVSVMMEGSQCDFPAILKGYDAAYDWIRANGYKESGAPLEVWLSKPGEQDRMEILWLFNEA